MHKKLFFWLQTPPKYLKPLLFIFSLLFALAVAIKNFFYDYNFIKPLKVKPFVISVGNIVAGGSGKTPFILFLLEKLKGKRVAVLTRGYGSEIKGSKIVEKEDSWQEVGDEALLMKKRFPEIIVISGKDRLQSAKIAQKLGVEIIILDDGFQKRALHRDLDIVLDATSNYFLPFGRLRDFKSRFKEADFVISIEKYPKRFLNLQQEEVIPQKEVSLFAAIANPKSFIKMVNGLGLEVKKTLLAFDHTFFLEKELKALNATQIICTEKDAIKIKNSSLPILYLEIGVKIDEDIIAKIIKRINNRVYERS